MSTTKLVTPSLRAMLTPPQLAERWGVSADKILGFIRRGELRAINLAATTSGRPRYRIDPADVATFEQRRAAGPAATAPRRRSVSGDVIKFF